MFKNNCKDLVVYEKRKHLLSKIIQYDTLTGLKCSKDSIYKFISYNNFEKIPTKIPNGYVRKYISSKLKQDYYCGTKKILLKDNEAFKKIKYIGYKRYYTHNNGSRPYLIYLSNRDAFIYKIPNNVEIPSSSYSKTDDYNRWMYIKLVKHIKFIKSFVGKCPETGQIFNGNSILLQTNKNTYIFIGNLIKEFKIDDDIIKFISPIGNNDVPYPYAIGNKNIYSFVYPYGYLPIKYFTNIKNNNLFNDELRQYDPFFIPFNKKKTKYKISLEEFKEIQKKKLEDIPYDTIKTLAQMFKVTISGSKLILANRIEELRRIKVYSN